MNLFYIKDILLAYGVEKEFENMFEQCEKAYTKIFLQFEEFVYDCFMP